MCGRFSLTTAFDTLLPRLQGPMPHGLAEHYAPRIQVRPGEPLLLQRQEHGRLAVGLALWGLVPEWSKDPLARGRPINARCETVAEKPFFRGPWRHRRALLPADGFYEWQHRTDPATGKPWKQPWLFRRRDCAPFWLGGLWDRWCGPDGGELESCVVLTTAPNDLLRRVHDRMPVVIPDGLEEAWLGATDGSGLRALEPLMGAWDPAAWEAVKLEPAALQSAEPKGVGSFTGGGLSTMGRRISSGDQARASRPLPVVAPLDQDHGATVGSVQLDLLDGSSA